MKTFSHYISFDFRYLRQLDNEVMRIRLLAHIDHFVPRDLRLAQAEIVRDRRIEEDWFLNDSYYLRGWCKDRRR